MRSMALDAPDRTKTAVGHSAGEGAEVGRTRSGSEGKALSTDGNLKDLFTASRVIPLHSHWPEDLERAAKEIVEGCGSCAQAVLQVFLEGLEFDAPLVLRAAGGFHAGMLHSATCGIYSAGMMVLGLLVGRQDLNQGREGLHPILDPARVLFHNLESGFGSSSCLELSGLDFADPDLAPMQALEARSACHSLVGKGARIIADTLQELVSSGLMENPGDSPAEPHRGDPGFRSHD